MIDWRGRTVFVTAGAGGMGRAFARHCASHGANLVIADIDGDAAQALAATLPSALGVACDVQSAATVDAARDTALARFGAVDFVMSHAGITKAGALADFTDADWQRILDLNVIGMARVLRAFAPHFIARNSGHFILTSSSLALLAGHPLSAFAAPYVASKAAVIGLAQATRVALAPHGIGVTLFAPDLTDTGFARPPAGAPAASPLAGQRQTPEQAVTVLLTALDAGRFLASASPDFHARLVQLAEADLDPLATASLAVS